MKRFEVFTGARNTGISIPEENFLYFAEHQEHDTGMTEEELIMHALTHPYESDGLDAIPKDAKVVILVDDATRPTPGARIVPHVMKLVEKRTSNICFITAPGTHRPLNDSELELKIGKPYLDQYKVFNLNYKNSEEYRYIGDMASGTPLHIHKAVLDADYKISIGNIGPHNMVGWSGGAKMLQPGVSGEITTADTHVRGAYYRLLDTIGNVDCPLRKEIDEFGEKIGLDFIVNTVLDMDKRILGLFCGHFLKAHREGVAFARKTLCPLIPGLADVVIVSAYPCFLDYWQGLKPLAFSMFGVKQGGTIIYLFDPPEGMIGNSPAHKDALYAYMKSDEKTVLKALDDGVVPDRVGATNPLYHFQILEHANVICISNNLTDVECELLSFTRAQDIEEALSIAMKQQGPQAKIGIIPFGGETLVRVE